MAKVSVIIPIFNGENYVEYCVECLLKQTLSDIEIILVNDGSIDRTKNICDQLEKINSRIKAIHQDNEGVSSARNKGIENASGDYICFIDCDDFIEKDYLERLYNACECNGVKMSACCIDAIDEDNNLISRKTLEKGFYNYQDALYELFKFNTLNSGPYGKLFHKSVFNNELKFKNIRTYEDLLFVYKAIYLSRKMYFIDDCKYYYVHRKGVGAMDKFIKNPTVDVIIAANEILEFIKEKVPHIFDSSFYGVISQVIMYINDINNIDPNWSKENSKIYIKETKKILTKYRFDIIKNKSMFFKEKIAFLIFSYSSNMYKNIIK